jgi:hypothetical protein
MDQLRSKVESAYKLGLAKDMTACWRMLTDLLCEYPVEVLKPIMAEVDPDRLVWDSPVRPGETGMHGHPLYGHFYQIVSDVYGHQINLPVGDWDDSFIHAFQSAHETGVLYDEGNLAIDLTANKLVFLVAIRLSDNTVLSNEVLDELSDRYAVRVRPLAWPNFPRSSGGYDSGFVCITAALEYPLQFNVAGDLASDIYEAERQHHIDRGTSPA